MAFDPHNDSSSSSSSDSNDAPKDVSSVGNASNRFDEDGNYIPVFRCLQVFLSLLFVSVGAALCVGTYASIRRRQQNDFETKFADMAKAIAESSVSNAIKVSDRMELLATGITSDAQALDVQWPLMTVANFDLMVEAFLNLTSADVVGFSPIVTDNTRQDWENYTAASSQYAVNASDSLWNDNGLILENALGPFVPVWQMAPFPSNGGIAVNFDLSTLETFSAAFASMQQSKQTSLSQPVAQNISLAFQGLHSEPGMDVPYSLLLHPVYRDFGKGSEIVGTLTALLQLHGVFLLSGFGNHHLDRLFIVIRDTCGKNYTYSILDTTAEFLGMEDMHDSSYDSMVETVFLTEELYGVNNNFDCGYILDIYPTRELEDSFDDNTQFVYPAIGASIFLATGLLFWYYNWTVKRLHQQLTNEAAASNNMLKSMFPAIVHRRLVEDQLSEHHHREHSTVEMESVAPKRSSILSRESHIEDENGEVNGVYKSKPIADLFPHCTIFFADISGFTAWSSEREPGHIFALLETIFRTFDKLAQQMKVFKVETIGDCYVSVTGLPTPREDHAVVMATFARTCMEKMAAVVQKLEVSLGPGTAGLTMRAGLHSGPVIAGVLRGDKTRFQLFGDSVNTAARVETTGAPGRIHMSQETAELLISAGKSRWVVPRRDLVSAKGKGVMRTYWLVLSEQRNLSSSTLGGSEADNSEVQDETVAQSLATTWGTAAVGVQSFNRLVEWNVDVLYQLLVKVVEKRQSPTEHAFQVGRGLNRHGDTSTRLLKEHRQCSERELGIDPNVKAQLRAYVSLIASMYREHPFHNFQHASHVMLSITKLLSRITAPQSLSLVNEEPTHIPNSQLRDNTFGIAYDPLLQFSVAFSALIHDVDHAGVPNAQLSKEDVNLAKKYRFKSVAEKHSIRLAWERLMDTNFRAFRQCLCPNQNELKRFRNFVVNTVMATDIADKELNGKRKERWGECFDDWPECPTNDQIQQKATIVIEHLIQASDVAHTMQHFEVYKKWNERLFYEVYSAYECGRSDVNPSLQWYNGETNFFDLYIIPLAKKLGACGVFGVSSDEYLSFALENRDRWSHEGEALVSLWLRNYKAKDGNYK